MVSIAFTGHMQINWLKTTNVLVCPQEKKSEKAEKSSWILDFIKRGYKVETLIYWGLVEMSSQNLGK